MILGSDERKRIRAAVNSDADLAAATAVLVLDGVAYPLSWTDSPSGAVLSRMAETVAWFAGPDVPVGVLAGATILAEGRHRTRVLVTIGATIAEYDGGYVIVRP